MRAIIKHILSSIFFWQKNKNIVFVFLDQRELPNYPDYIQRSEFYLKKSYKAILYKNKLELYIALLKYGPHRVIFSSKGLNKQILKLHFLNVDYINNPHDGWDWHHALKRIRPVLQEELDDSKRRFLTHFSTIPKYASSLILGTGPSLVKARKLVDIDSYKIACNTIVKDLDLWVRLKPHFLVAGDAIYHFGHNQYATSFRRDLKKCMQAYGVPFLYPDLYHPFLKEEFKEIAHLLIPIPTGDIPKINNNLFDNFQLPALGNVLNLLLLPLATTLSKKIYLLGFDGRAPEDKLFWSNSNDHSYGEHISDIQKKHPMFFDYYIDKKDPLKYVATFHGDVLEDNLTLLEHMGYEFITLSPSYTPTIQKRYKSVFDLE